MKKSILVLLSILVCAATINIASAKSTSNPSLASAIRMYKAGNYAQSYNLLTNIVSKDPSNAVAYYYLAMNLAQIGKKDEAIANYEKVLTLSTNGQLTRYAKKGKTCLEDPEKCNEPTDDESDMDKFIRRSYGSGFSKEARSEYEKQKIENLMREMNRKDDIPAQKFRDYKDFSSEVPTNDEIVTALRTLQRAGLSNMVLNNSYSELSALSGRNNNEYDMINMLIGGRNNSLSPQVIQSLITNQMSF